MDVSGLVESAARLGLTEDDCALLGRCLREPAPSVATGAGAEALRDLTEVLADPSCSERQADGVSCGDPIGHCEGCRRASVVVVSLMARVRRFAGG
jgi:hypothetical protein